MSAAEVGADLQEAKSLLAKAKRPAVKAALTSFIKTATAKELALLGAADDEEEGEDPTLCKEFPAGPPNCAPSEPKPPAPSENTPDLLPPAPKFKAAPSSLPKDIASPAPTKLVRAGSAAPEPAAGTQMNWEVPNYGWEQGEYNSPWVNIMLSIDGVGVARDRCHCDFGVDSFDLRVTDVGGANYRLFVEALDKDIIPEESRVIVKKNRVTLKLKKVKGEYSYDHWSDLKKKGGKAAKEKTRNADPSAGIMDMMKDLYDNGDDNMRKIIGESMMKSQRGEKTDPKDFDMPRSPSMPMPGTGKDDFDLDKDGVGAGDDFEKPPPFGAPGGMPPQMPDLSKIPGMEDFKMDK